MVAMIRAISRFFFQLIRFLFRRGTCITKFLFFIDDFFRLFAMTFLIPIFFAWFGFGNTLRTLGVILGLIIDIHDFISDFGKGADTLRGIKR